MYRNLSPKVLGVSGFQSELIELALSHGFKGLEIDVVDFIEKANSRGLDHARRLIDSARIKLGHLQLPVALSAADEAFDSELECLQGAAEHLATVGCDHLVTTIEPGSDDLPYHENFERHRKRLVALADVLDPHGIRLGIGFRGIASARQGKAFEFIHDLDALMTLVESAAESTGASIDVWDVVVAGSSVDDLKKIAASRMVAVQLSDGPADQSPQQWDETSRQLPGETGVIDSAAVLVWLAESDFEGPVTPVPHRSQFKGTTRENIVRRTGEKLNEVWKLAGLTPSGKLDVPVEQPA